jgi:hypothetical protein
MTQPIPPGQPPRPQPTPIEPPPQQAPPPREDPDALPPSAPIEEPLQSPDDTPRAPNDKLTGGDGFHTAARLSGDGGSVQRLGLHDAWESGAPRAHGCCRRSHRVLIDAVVAATACSSMLSSQPPRAHRAGIGQYWSINARDNGAVTQASSGRKARGSPRRGGCWARAKADMGRKRCTAAAVQRSSSTAAVQRSSSTVISRRSAASSRVRCQAGRA